MTIQIPDRFIYNGEEHEIVNLDGEKLITPYEYGIYLEIMVWSSCHRGFYSTYEINDDGLFLTEMVINKIKEGHKPIQGIMPKTLSDSSSVYQGLKILTPFTGRIRLGKDFEDEIYLNDSHFGLFCKNPVCYGTLLDLTFDAGKLVSMQDISAENAAKRATLEKYVFNEEDYYLTCTKEPID